MTDDDAIEGLRALAEAAPDTVAGRLAREVYDVWSRPLYYGRDGEPITQNEWSRAMRQPRHIGNTRIARCWVSTVWLGLDHSWVFGGPPIIFETMIFVPRYKDRGRVSSPQDWQTRYSTEDQARLGHERVVNRLRSRGFAGIMTWEAP